MREVGSVRLANVFHVYSIDTPEKILALDELTLMNFKNADKSSVVALERVQAELCKMQLLTTYPANEGSGGSSEAREESEPATSEGYEFFELSSWSEERLEEFILNHGNVRLSNVLKANKINTVPLLLDLTTENLRKFRNAGGRSAQILEKLQRELIMALMKAEGPQLQKEAHILTMAPQGWSVKPSSFIHNKLLSLNFKQDEDLLNCALGDLIVDKVGAYSLYAILEFAEAIKRHSDSTVASISTSEILTVQLDTSVLVAWHEAMISQPVIASRLTSFGIENYRDLGELTIMNLFDIVQDRITVLKQLIYYNKQLCVGEGGCVKNDDFEVVDDPIKDSIKFALSVRFKAKKAARLYAIAESYYFGGASREEIGAVDGTSGERVRQLLMKIRAQILNQLTVWRHLAEPAPAIRSALSAWESYRQPQLKWYPSDEHVLVSSSVYRIYRLFNRGVQTCRLPRNLGQIVSIDLHKKLSATTLDKVLELIKNLVVENPYVSRASTIECGLSEVQIDQLLDLPILCEEAGERSSSITLANAYAPKEVLAYKYLFRRDEPTHYKIITDFVNQHYYEFTTPESLKNLLHRDKRFVSQGRTGRYALKEWGLNTDCIRVLIAKCLRANGGSLPMQKLIRAVQKYRPHIKADSVYSISLMSFTVFNDVVNSNARTDEQVKRAVSKAQRGRCKDRIMELLEKQGALTYKSIQQALGGDFSELTIRHTLAKRVFRNVTTQGRIALYDINSYPVHRKQAPVKTKFQQLLDRATALIADKEMRLSEAVNELHAKTFSRADIYKVFSHPTFHKRRGEEGALYVSIKHK